MIVKRLFRTAQVIHFLPDTREIILFNRYLICATIMQSLSTRKKKASSKLRASFFQFGA